MKSSEAPRSATRGADTYAGALHEVSNALTVVLGWLEEARRAASGSVRDAIDVAHTHARLGHAIAREAIGADVEAAAPQLTASSLAKATALGVSKEAARRGVSIRVDDPGAPDVILPAAGAAQQVLVNLLLNAVAFSPEQGSVTLSVDVGPSQVVFGVEDQGPGVPPERAETLFSSPGSTRAGGAGIGLWHAHMLARSSGGELALVRTGPEGTRFELRWPIGEAASGTVHSLVAPVSLEGARVLVLEDDAAVLSLIELGLSARGATVVAVSSMEEFQQVIARGVFDVALVDLSPMGADPTTVLRDLRVQGRGLPVVVISGSVAPEVAPDAVDAWVRKPFEVGELIDAICRVRRPS